MLTCQTYTKKLHQKHAIKQRTAITTYFCLSPSKNLTASSSVYIRFLFKSTAPCMTQTVEYDHNGLLKCKFIGRDSMPLVYIRILIVVFEFLCRVCKSVHDCVEVCTQHSINILWKMDWELRLQIWRIFKSIQHLVCALSLARNAIIFLHLPTAVLEKYAYNQTVSLLK